MNCYICHQPVDLREGYLPQPEGRAHATCYGEWMREQMGFDPMKGDRLYDLWCERMAARREAEVALTGYSGLLVEATR